MPRDVVEGDVVYRYVGSLRGEERERAEVVLTAGRPPLRAPGRPPAADPLRLLCGCREIEPGEAGPSIVRIDGSCARCSP